jgi:hypothetical protein
MRALASLADLDYQRRVWVDKEYPGLDFYDDFKANVDCLYDDCRVLPSPEGMLGAVLLSGDELVRLNALGVVLDRVIDRHVGQPDVIPVSDPDWIEVTRLSALALAAIVRAGGFADG